MSAKRKFEEILDDLKDLGVDDDLVAELEQFSGSNLRKQASRVSELESEVQKLQVENKSLKDRPEREKAFKEYGIDLDSLRPAERELVMAAEAPEDGFTPEWVGTIAEKYDLPVENEGAGEEGNQETGSTEPAAAAQVRQATNPAQRGGKTTITPEEANEWSTEKLLRFRDEHPEAYENLKRGEAVNGIAFS